jgi:hypothetical protein
MRRKQNPLRSLSGRDGCRIRQVKVIVDLLCNFNRDRNIRIRCIELTLEFLLVKLGSRWHLWLLSYSVFSFLSGILSFSCCLLL